MLTANGCRKRRERFWQRLDPAPASDYLLLSDPINLAYLANCWADPISLGSWFHAYLLVRKDGHGKLLRADKAPKSMQQAHADETRVVPWYDGQSPATGPRQLAVLQQVNPARDGLRVHDRPGDPLAAQIISTIAQMRRQKDPDEVELLKTCMRVTDAGHAWARANIRPGMTELDVYSGVSAACIRAAGHPVVIYGDFAVSPGPEKRGGAPTERVLAPGDMFILDYSVIIQGYRSDFTNTLVVGKEPTPAQQHLCDLSLQAMAAGEKTLRAGATCQAVFDAVSDVYATDGVVFPHHAGHGIGLSHPENPYLVRRSTETLLAGDVVTLEPGMYVAGVGGLRIEHNYLVTETGYERLSNHVIALK